MLDLASPRPTSYSAKSSTSQLLEPSVVEIYCGLGQMEYPGTNVDLVFFFKKSYGGSYGDFLNLVFLITLPKKNDRLDLKLGRIDASRHQLQSVLKIGV